MGFGLESEMSGPVRRWLNHEDLAVKGEFSVPWGICDFVGLSFDQKQVQKRLAYGQFRPVGPLHRVELLRQIPDQESGDSVTLQRLKEWSSCFQLPALEAALQRLIDGRFIVRNSDGLFQKLNGWEPLHRRIVAVELKLSRISQVLAQAASHRAFATESYVAMPTEIAERLAGSSRSSEFYSKGVGILAVARKGCKVLFAPSRLGLDIEPTLQMHCVERFWRTRGNSS